MRLPIFELELHVNGSIAVKRFRVRANPCRGLKYVPDFGEICREVPAKYWPAIQRGGWWSDKNCPALPMRLDMTDKRGAPMGTLFATQTGESQYIAED